MDVYEPKKTGARSARTRTRGQNPVVFNIDLQKFWASSYKNPFNHPTSSAGRLYVHKKQQSFHPNRSPKKQELYILCLEESL